MRILRKFLFQASGVMKKVFEFCRHSLLARKVGLTENPDKFHQNRPLQLALSGGEKLFFLSLCTVEFVRTAEVLSQLSW